MQNPKPKSPLPKERKWVDYSTSRYLADLLKDSRRTTAIHAIWDDLESILLATQRNLADEERPAACVALKAALQDLKMFADQGKLDLEYIKNTPAP